MTDRDSGTPEERVDDSGEELTVAIPRPTDPPTEQRPTDASTATDQPKPAQPKGAQPDAAQPASAEADEAEDLEATQPLSPSAAAHPPRDQGVPEDARGVQGRPDQGKPREASRRVVTPTPVPDGPDEPRAEGDRSAAPTSGGPAGAARRRRGFASVAILVLLALLGFTLAIQLRGESLDSDLAAMREDDLVRLQSDLSAQEDRLQREIAALEESQRQLQSGQEGRKAAIEEATRRADELEILAGTAPARGPGLTIRFISGPQPIGASDILNAVQELRGADAEAMQIAGADGTAVRVIASTYFVDAEGGLEVSGKRLTGPYVITVIGDPPTMRTALNIPDGLVPSIKADGGNVIVDEREVVDVTALSTPVDLRFARPVS